MSPVTSAVIRYLQPASLVLVTLVVGSGIITALSLTVLQSQRNALLENRAKLVSAIKKEEAKEAMMVLGHANLLILGKIIDQQKSFTPYIDVTRQISGTLPISSFSFGEGTMVSLSLSLPGLEDAVITIRKVLDLTEKHTIASPVLEGVTVEENGRVKLDVSYLVIL
jgi:hypothetical protein